MDYLTWTYLFRRLYKNPTYYGVESADHKAVSRFLSGIVEKVLRDLMSAKCLDEPDTDDPDYDPDALIPSVLGRIASFYYLNHQTVLLFEDYIQDESTLQDILKVLCDAQEFAEIPVRHNEDKLNADLARSLPFQVCLLFQFQIKITKGYVFTACGKEVFFFEVHNVFCN